MVSSYHITTPTVCRIKAEADNMSSLLLLHYIRLTAFFPGQRGKPAPEWQTIMDFTGARDDGVAVVSAGPYTNHLHLAPDR